MLTLEEEDELMALDPEVHKLLAVRRTPLVGADAKAMARMIDLELLAPRYADVLRDVHALLCRAI